MAVTLMVMSIACENPIAIVFAVMAFVCALAYKRKVIHVIGYSSCTSPAEEEILIPVYAGCRCDLPYFPVFHKRVT